MKQTTKRILSLVLSLVVMLSVVSVYTFAANNYTPDEEYYNNVISDSFVVNPAWEGLEKGDPVTFEFAGKTYTENFDPTTRFSTIQAAVDAAKLIGENYSPVIALLPGFYNDPAEISADVTFVGPNGGVNPVVKSNQPNQAWSKSERYDEAKLNAAIVINTDYRKNVEVVFDGVTMYHKFAYIDCRTMAAESNVIVKNTVIDGAGSANYLDYSASSVFFFGNSRNITASVEVCDTYIENMASSSVFSTRVTNINVHDICFTTSKAGLLSSTDGQTDINPNYVVKDSMFCNNNATGGVISVNYSTTDTNLRTSTSLEIYNCSFLDGTYTDFNELAEASPINITLVGPKNNVNIHDNFFKGKSNYEASAVAFQYVSKALSDEMKDNIKVNNNKFCGFVNLPDTEGVNILTSLDFTGNYFANSYENQKDPVFKYPKSAVNLKLDYFYVDSELKYKSSDFYMIDFGVNGARIDNLKREVYAVVDFTQKINVNIKTNNDKTTFKLYSDYDCTQEVTVVDPTTFGVTGQKAYYAQSSSILYPSYKYKYTVYLSTSDPAQAIKFDKPSTYFVSEQVASYSNGSVYYAEWDGISYSFIVGENAFADTADIFARNDACPTILLSPGEYTKNIYVTKSAIILGQKHGINPNVTDFVNYDKPWSINPERSQADQETILKNATIVFMPQTTGAILEVDGITLGTFSAIDDRNSLENFSTTLIVSNVIINDAGNASYPVPGSTSVTAPATIINCAPSAGKEASTNHKTGRFTNIRMVGQKGQPLFDMMAENAIFDGIYAEANSSKLFRMEITSPMKQNMHFEIRNSFFINNTPADYYFIVNHNLARSAEREYSAFVLKNNVFFGNTTSKWGIFGVRYGSAQDICDFSNNIFASSVAVSLSPGSVGWFIGAVGNGPVLNNQDIVDQDNIIIKYNRFLGTLGPKAFTFPSMDATNEKSRYDVSYNYFSDSLARADEGGAPKAADAIRHKCDVYFSDWDMKQPSVVTEEYNKALGYAINAPGILNGKTYTDNVSALTETYDFDIELTTPQASYGVYSDAACTNKLAHPVQLAGGQNVFYIRFESFDKSVTDTITATITKPQSTQIAGLTAFGTAKIDGNNIFAVVPVGTTTYAIPSANVPVQVYNDSGCTLPFTSSVITGITTTPTVKYVKANGVKYTLTVLQAVNDQAELISVGGGQRVSDTEFKVDILSSWFMIEPVYSSAASIKVTVNSQEIAPNEDGYYYIQNIATSKTAVITVTAENGNKKTYTVNIIRGASTSKVVSIFNMTPNGSDNVRFDTIISDAIFKVEPTLEGIGATYQVYSDKACTQPVIDNIAILSARETTMYLKVVSADKTSTNLVTLNITCTRFPKFDKVEEKKYNWSIEGATLVPGTTDCYTVVANKTNSNAKNFKLVVNLEGKKYKKSYFEILAVEGGERVGETTTVNNKTAVPLNGRNTRYFVRLYICEGEESVASEKVYLTIVKPQAAVTYADAAATADWAKPYVDYLNNNGFAYFVGDSNKNFNANTGISRFEVAVVVCKMLGINVNYTKTGTVPFTDEIPEWASPYVKACFKLGIMSGKSETSFDGYAKTTRQEFARVITQTIAVSQGDLTPINDIYSTNKALIDLLYERMGFADESTVAEWAKPGIRLAVAHYNVMSGSAQNGKLYVNPTNDITRQEVAVLIAKHEGAQ